MNSYRKFKRTMLLLPLLFFVVGYAAIPLPNNEIFPVYSWSMFALVPGNVVEYEVWITRAEGNPLPEPVEFRKAGNLVMVHSPVVTYRVIQKMGRAVDEGNAEEIQQMRRHFERNHMHPATAYRIDRVTCDVLQRWRGGEMQRERIGEFAWGR